MSDLPVLRASVALAGYAESLAEGRRVLVFGDASSGLADQLIERGARLVHVFDPDRVRAAEAAARSSSQNVTYAPLGDGGLALRDGAFDLAIVDNLGALVDAGREIGRIKRALSPRGTALIATPNPEARLQLVPEPGPSGLDYYGLYDAVAAHFDEVRMLGQTPFVGYAVVDFGAQESDPEPALDSAFLPNGAEEPEWFVALGSREAIELEAFAVVQLPLARVLRGSASRDLDAQLTSARSSEGKARERIAVLEAEAAEQRARENQTAVERESAADVARVRAELERREAWIVQLEARATTADARADEAEAEIEKLRARGADAQGLRAELTSLRERAEREARQRAQRAADDAQAAHDAVTTLDAELVKARNEALAKSAKVGELEARLAAASEVSSPDLGVELAALEAQLLERGQTLARLERELRDAVRVGRNLVHQLDALAGRNAALEADLAEARWQIEATESRKSAGGAPSGALTAASPALISADRRG